jgi:hypothetical protein
LLIFFTFVHHAQHGLVLECSRTPEHKDAHGGLVKEKNHLVSMCEVMEQGIKPMLDLIGMEPKETPSDWPVRPEAIVEKCQNS